MKKLLISALIAGLPGVAMADAKGDEIAKLAIETGVWPLKEAKDGVVRHTYRPTRFRPVEEYLRPQRRFRHLFAPQRNEELLARRGMYYELVQKQLAAA